MAFLKLFIAPELLSTRSKVIALFVQYATKRWGRARNKASKVAVACINSYCERVCMCGGVQEFVCAYVSG